MFNSEFYSWASIVDHRNRESQNPDCSDFNNLDADDLDIDGHLFWAIDIWIVNSWITFDKNVECFEKNFKKRNTLTITRQMKKNFFQMCREFKITPTTKISAPELNFEVVGRVRGRGVKYPKIDK